MSRIASLGIDLGTTNSALALCEQGSERAHALPIRQLSSDRAASEPLTLASALYIPTDAERAGLPEIWEGYPTSFIVGHYARERGSASPERLITSAKSWLCNTHVDRREKILPWGSENFEEKFSPIEASSAYLKHLVTAYRFSNPSNPPLDDCELVITVPASFDEVARSLTLEAARSAGLERVTLLEEPLAAFYAWLSSTEGAWREQVQPGDVVLVIDIGGGTSDFTLVAVSEQRGELELRRISVGDHILLGGDNMDLTLAYVLRQQLEAEGKTLDHWQFLSLIHAAKRAKEALWSEADTAEVPISIAGKGSSLFASNVRTSLSRDVLEKVILEGFFPESSIDQMPQERAAIGLREVGLPYASDPGLSRHLARFLVRSLENVQSDEILQESLPRLEEWKSQGFIQPTAILFNGGVFHAPVLQQRVMHLLESWSGSRPTELAGADLDQAVSRGAAFYGRIRLAGDHIRVRSGTARSYYIGVELSMPAVPGIEPPVQGICVVPQGMEEGSECELSGQEFGLVTGEAVEFRFFSSSVRSGDSVGTVVPSAARELEEAAKMSTTISSETSDAVIPVHLHARVTELGALELSMRRTDSAEEWKLEFDVRGE